MLASFRRFTATWPAKVFFVLLVASFGLWGVADVARNLLGGGDPNSVATVGNQRVSPAELQDVTRRMLAQRAQQLQRMNPGAPSSPPEERRAVAGQALEGLVVQAALAGEAARLRVSVPDDALRAEIGATRGFQGPDGQFNRAVYNAALRTNGYTEPRYLGLLRTDLAQREVIEAVRSGGTSPDAVNRLTFAYDGETRTADLVTLPFASAAQPQDPTETQLQRYYDDSAGDYRSPEYRRIKVVVLSPESLAKDIDVSDAEAQAYYDVHATEYTQAAARSVQVVVAPTEAAGRALATTWITGADWEAMQRAAEAAGASAVALDRVEQGSFPSPELAGPVFGAAPEVVTGPVQAEGGWAVFRVSEDQPAGEQPFSAVAADVKARVGLEQATDQVFDRANKVQDALAAGTLLDDLPSDFGLIAVTGTLDQAGNTPEGAPAPLPGGPAFRQAIIDRAFAVARGEPPTLEQGPDHSSFALTVDTIDPPAQQPLEQVRDRVRENWLTAARRHEQDVIATGLMTAVAAGASLQDVAAAAGVPVTRSLPVHRGRQPGVADQLVAPLFATEPGKATMVETPDGFVVAVPVAVSRPDPAGKLDAMDRLRLVRAGQVSNDLELTFAAAVREREGVTLNRQVFDSIAP